MKKQFMNKLTILAICLFALSLTAFGQKTDGYVGSTKSNVKNALTREPMAEKNLKEMQNAIKPIKLEAKGPGALYKSAVGTFTFALINYADNLTFSSSRVARGVNVGVIQVDAGSKELPNGYYIVNLKQFATDAKGNPLYGITLTNMSGVQALAIGPKTNGTAGNTNGLGAKRVGAVAVQANGKDCPTCTVMMPLFKKTGDVETLQTEGLDTQIVEMVAAFVSSTKSNTKTA
jgi:hypothetical protein